METPSDPVHRTAKSKRTATFMAPVQLVVGRHRNRIIPLNWTDDRYISHHLSQLPAD